MLQSHDVLGFFDGGLKLVDVLVMLFFFDEFMCVTRFSLPPPALVPILLLESDFVALAFPTPYHLPDPGIGHAGFAFIYCVFDLVFLLGLISTNLFLGALFPAGVLGPWSFFVFRYVPFLFILSVCWLPPVLVVGCGAGVALLVQGRPR